MRWHKACNHKRKNEPMNYEWTITKDHLAAGLGMDSEVGKVGPSRATRTCAQIEHDPKARSFRMLDDDREVYYTGRIVADEGSEGDFGPLDDFGTPNAGCTTIQYRNAQGEWEDL